MMIMCLHVYIGKTKRQRIASSQHHKTYSSLSPSSSHHQNCTIKTAHRGVDAYWAALAGTLAAVGACCVCATTCSSAPPLLPSSAAMPPPAAATARSLPPAPPAFARPAAFVAIASPTTPTARATFLFAIAATGVRVIVRVLGGVSVRVTARRKLRQCTIS